MLLASGRIADDDGAGLARRAAGARRRDVAATATTAAAAAIRAARATEVTGAVQAGAAATTATTCAQRRTPLGAGTAGVSVGVRDDSSPTSAAFTGIARAARSRA